jgi:metal-sulfur cluster biosynthetic enzyme
MTNQTLKPGDLVRLTRDAERFPDFLVRKGSVGTVKTVEPDLVQVRMHATIEGCEHWDNIVDWYLDVDLEHVDVDLEKIGSAPEPKTRAQKAIEEAEIDFWSTVARFYPEIDTGDFPPCDASKFLAACTDAVETWVDHNSTRED